MPGGSGAYASSSEKNMKLWCSLVCFGVYFDQIVKRNQDLTVGPPPTVKSPSRVVDKNFFYKCKFLFRKASLGDQGCDPLFL